MPCVCSVNDRNLEIWELKSSLEQGQRIMVAVKVDLVFTLRSGEFSCSTNNQLQAQTSNYIYRPKS